MLILLGQACRIFMIFSILTGLFYPLAITGLAQILFPWRANGSLFFQQEHCVGSEFIGQYFTSDIYFWSRPSATTNFPYNALASKGSNWGPSNPNYLKKVKERLMILGVSQKPIPIDLVTASSSGLDPHILISSAHYQMERIAQNRNIPVVRIKELIDSHAETSILNRLEEPVINVLKLNMALDALQH